MSRGSKTSWPYHRHYTGWQRRLQECLAYHSGYQSFIYFVGERIGITVGQNKEIIAAVVVIGVAVNYSKKEIATLPEASKYCST